MTRRVQLLGLAVGCLIACGGGESGSIIGSGGSDGDGASGPTTSGNPSGSGQGAGGPGSGAGGLGSGAGGPGSGGGGAAATGTATSGSTGATSGNGSGGSGCQSGPNDDADMDGFTPSTGDCNDCDPNVNPGAIEVIVTDPSMDGGVPTPADEDCDGMVDNVPPPCDGNIALDDFVALNGAHAIDLCQEATPADKKWGVLSAAYVRADGSAAPQSPQVGILDGFGPNVPVQLGSRMLGLSSGHARLPGQPDACNTYLCDGYGAGTAPVGFPQDVPNCAGSTAINDDVGLELTLRAPTNATGYSFLFDFYSFEYPEWVCTNYNDQFIALVSPPPMGSINGNISFDSQANPVSVNIAFFDVCSGCAQGTAELAGTGFDGSWGDDAGATSWLKTTAPIGGGEEFTIRFAIWDTGDQVWDSTVLVDSFQWIANGGTVSVGTVHM